MEKNLIVQCLHKRKGGSIHTFGHHNAKQEKYHFEPVDPKDEDSAHVCTIAQSDPHLQDFLAIKEGFRVYSEGDTVLSIPKVQTPVDTDKLKNRYEDLLSVDPELVDGIWLEGYAREVLDIDPKSTQLLKARYSDGYGLTLSGKPTNLTVIRAILKAQIAEEKQASELAEKIGAPAATGEKKA